VEEKRSTNLGNVERALQEAYFVNILKDELSEVFAIEKISVYRKQARKSVSRPALLIIKAFKMSKRSNIPKE
jgi:hypothetical protein